MLKEDECPYLQFVSNQFGEREDCNEWYNMELLIKEEKVSGFVLNVLVDVHDFLCKNFSLEYNAIGKEIEFYKYNNASFPANSVLWGYEPLLKTIKKDNGWVSYEIDVSLEIDQTALSKTLDRVFNILNLLYEGVSMSDIPQITTIDCLFSKGGMSGCALGSHVSSKVRDWTERQSDMAKGKTLEHPDQPEATMMEIYDLLNPNRSKNDEHSFNCILDGDCFTLTVPGNCACFFVDGNDKHQDKGRCYKMHSHNIDCLDQQFSILAGLVYIWQEVRKELVLGGKNGKR